MKWYTYYLFLNQVSVSLFERGRRDQRTKSPNEVFFSIGRVFQKERLFSLKKKIVSITLHLVFWSFGLLVLFKKERHPIDLKKDSKYTTSFGLLVIWSPGPPSKRAKNIDFLGLWSFGLLVLLQKERLS